LFNNSSNEKKKLIHKFKFSDDKKRSILGEHLLKLALKENQITNYKIKDTTHGKPFLVDSKKFKFNISHSGDWVVLAFDNDGIEVGVDVEKICKIDYNGITKRFFSKEEYEFLNNHSSRKEMLKNFYMLWTLKESYAKMLGIGLSLPLNSFSVIENSFIKEQIKEKETNKMYYLKNIEIIEGYQLSVSSENKKVSEEDKFIPLHQLIH